MGKRKSKQNGVDTPDNGSPLRLRTSTTSTSTPSGHVMSTSPDSTSPPLSPSSLPSTMSLSSSAASGSGFTEKTMTAADLPSLDGRPLPVVRVNKANLSELKASVDDVVRGILNDLQFKQSNRHTDVKLAMGWLAVLVAGATTAWSYKYGYKDTKNEVAVGVAAYILLSILQWGYAHYVEGEKIYIGKRKSLSKRIETELIRVSSSTSKPSSHSAPLYSLSLAYRRSANNNKSLIRKRHEKSSLALSDFVDASGGIEESRVADWIGQLVRDAVGGSESSSRRDSGTSSPRQGS